MTPASNTQLRRILERRFLFPFVWSAFESLHHGERFQPAWHVEAMCHALQRVARGECRRLLITVPPRHGKSICTAVCTPAWMLGLDPTLKIMVASYGGELAAKHARDFRTLIETPWFEFGFPALRLADGGNRADEQITTAGGGRKAISLGGAATGFGADLIIIDDLMKAADASSPVERQRCIEFYEQTLLSRLNDQTTGRIVVIQQRLHENDLPGYLIEAKQFEHLNLAAIAVGDESIPIGLGRVRHRSSGEALWPDRQSLAVLNKLRCDMGPMTFSAQYQQDPTPPGGNRMKWEWFKTFDTTLFNRRDYQYVLQSWDTASTGEPTSDYSACVTMGLRGSDWHILDVWCGRLDFGALLSKVKASARQWHPDKVLIEKAGSGIPLWQELRRTLENGWLYIWQIPKLDKAIRFEAQMARIEAGGYHVPAQALWLRAFRDELLGFPNRRHDDQVDALVQALGYIGAQLGEGLEERHPDTGRLLRVKRPQSLRPQAWPDQP